MFERFTDRARTSVVLAQEQARLLNHSYIGTEHILLGLLREGDGVAARVLGEMGVRLAAVCGDVEQIIGRGEEAPPCHIPFTPRAKKVLELSLREALQLGHNYIGTEHILLGIIREAEGVAAQVLIKYKGVTLEAVRERVLEFLGPGLGHRMARPTPTATARTPAAEDAIQAAERLAGDAPIGSHHLLEALVQAEGSMAANALAALGVDPEALGSKLSELRLEDTTDVTPEEAAARQMELRVDGEEVHVVLRDPASLERTKLIVGFVGGPVKGEQVTARGLTAVWREVQNTLAELEAARLPEQPPEEEIGRGRRRRRKAPKPEAD
jgi:ATP-dependent Clp protease ATP-binding subunit ClpA